MNRQVAPADWLNTKAGWADRVKEADRKEEFKRTTVENNNSRTKRLRQKGKSLSHTRKQTSRHSHEYTHNLSIVTATDIKIDTNVLCLFHFTQTSPRTANS